jgi:hypothetical protein
MPVWHTFLANCPFKSVFSTEGRKKGKRTFTLTKAVHSGVQSFFSHLFQKTKNTIAEMDAKSNLLKTYVKSASKFISAQWFFFQEFRRGSKKANLKVFPTRLLTSEDECKWF